MADWEFDTWGQGLCVLRFQLLKHSAKERGMTVVLVKY